MKKWEEFIFEFYEMISDEEKLVYQPIIETLINLDYTPLKKRTKGFILSFSNLAHNRVLARFGVREGGEKAFLDCVFHRACITQTNLPMLYEKEFWHAITALQNADNADIVRAASTFIPIRFLMGRSKPHAVRLYWKYPM